MTMGYYTQHQMDTLRGDTTVLGEIRRLSDPRTTEEELMSVLGLFMLGQDYFERQVSALSGGEKSRLVLATLFLKRCNFLLLDEPTNHLDLESREALVSALQKFNGTLLMIDALQSNEKFLQQTLDTLQAGVITIEPGSLKVRSINAFAQQFIGLPADEIVGKPCHEFICPGGVDLCPMGKDNPKGELLAGQLTSVDGTMKTIVKSVRAIEMKGEEIFLESFVDITDLETTRKELQRSEERYKTLFM